MHPIKIKIFQSRRKFMSSNKQAISWWIEVFTSNPNYLYYFGPFSSYLDAEWSKYDYIQDLEEEKAIIIGTEITQYQPKRLDIPIICFSDYINA